MNDCQLCGGKIEDGVCSRCGHVKSLKVFGDQRDGTIDEKPDFKQQVFADRDKKLKNAIVQLEEALLSGTTDGWIADLVSSAMLLLNIPLEMEARCSILLSETECSLVSVSKGVLDAIDGKEGAPSQQPEVYIRIANAFHIMGSCNEALEYYQRALLRQPFHEIALYNKASCLFTKSEYEGCTRELDKLLEHHPGCERALHLRELAAQMKWADGV
ncbi:MAG: hypothetical protein QCI38_05845 [Candidatus Thermoplasmatota archaeon]|nr:hypothetical protein [Candidatus Thermoplasmatota archaeon]